jgi:hypothetical protein
VSSYKVTLLTKSNINDKFTVKAVFYCFSTFRELVMKISLLGGYGTSKELPGIVELLTVLRQAGYEAEFVPPGGLPVPGPEGSRYPKTLWERASLILRHVDRYHPDVVIAQSADAISLMIAAAEMPQAFKNCQIILSCPAGLYKSHPVLFIGRLLYRWAADHLLGMVLDSSPAAEEYRRLSHITSKAMRDYGRTLSPHVALMQVAEINTDLTARLLHQRLDKSPIVLLGGEDLFFTPDRCRRALKGIGLEIVELPSVTHAFYRHARYWLGEVSGLRGLFPEFPRVQPARLANWFLVAQNVAVWAGGFAFVALLLMLTLLGISLLPH